MENEESELAVSSNKEALPTGTPTKAQNLQATICSLFKMFWGPDGAEIVGVTIQRLVQFEIHATREVTYPRHGLEGHEPWAK